MVLWTGTHHSIQLGGGWVGGLLSFGLGHIIVYSWGAPRLCAWSFGLGHIIVYSRGAMPRPLGWDTLYTAGVSRAYAVLWTTTLLYTAGVCGLLDWDTSLYTAGLPRICVVFGLAHRVAMAIHGQCRKILRVDNTEYTKLHFVVRHICP